MKPIHIILFIAAAIVGAIALADYNHRKRSKCACGKDQKDCTCNGNGNGKKKPLASQTVTTVVDPTTGDEYVVSDLGDNNLDMKMGTIRMEQSVSQIIQDIGYRTGVYPATVKLKVYDPAGKLVGETVAEAPNEKNTLSGSPAIENILGDGSTEFSCPTGIRPEGPGYYQTGSGETLFGMFCK